MIWHITLTDCCYTLAGWTAKHFLLRYHLYFIKHPMKTNVLQKILKSCHHSIGTRLDCREPTLSNGDRGTSVGDRCLSKLRRRQLQKHGSETNLQRRRLCLPPLRRRLIEMLLNGKFLVRFLNHDFFHQEILHIWRIKQNLFTKFFTNRCKFASRI